LNRPDRTIILAGLVFCIIWGSLFYFFARIYPDEWAVCEALGLGVPLLLMWYAMNIPEIVRDFVESIRDERLRDFLKILPDLPFFRYILRILIFAVFIVLLKAIEMFQRAIP
jgi:hypothetical protein